MPIWNPKLTKVTIEFDGPKGDRIRKEVPASRSRSFYTKKDAEGKNPRIVGAVDSTQT